MSTENAGNKEELVNSMGLTDEAFDTYKRVKAGGLSISVLDSNKKTDDCAYKSCDNPAIFCMEELLVCKSHAEKLLKSICS